MVLPGWRYGFEICKSLRSTSGNRSKPNGCWQIRTVGIGTILLVAKPNGWYHNQMVGSKTKQLVAKSNGW
jgi:hypothetical protein